MLITPTIIPAPDSKLQIWPSIFSDNKCEALFQQLYTDTLWRQEHISLFGKTHPTPRLQAWYGGSGTRYQYSGITLDPQPWNTLLLSIKQAVEHLCGYSFNSVLLNLYRNGQDSNGWHSDDEPELGSHPVIASLSFGETRRFRLRHKTRKETPSISLDLESGSLLLMSGETQQHWQHCIPKTSKTVQPRINLTFRKVV